jgi:hypothetical protein
MDACERDWGVIQPGFCLCECLGLASFALPNGRAVKLLSCCFFRHVFFPSTPFHDSKQSKHPME